MNEARTRAKAADARSSSGDLDVARCILQSVSDHKIVLSIPGTDYQVHLTPAVPAAAIATPLGKRIRGTIHARALRLFKASGGGRFIEPIWGEPRIVAGVVLALDAVARRALVDVAVPIWMTLDERQPQTKDQSSGFAVGDLVNCYVASGAVFEPV